MNLPGLLDLWDLGPSHWFHSVGLTVNSTFIDGWTLVFHKKLLFLALSFKTLLKQCFSPRWSFVASSYCHVLHYLLRSISLNIFYIFQKAFQLLPFKDIHSSLALMGEEFRHSLPPWNWVCSGIAWTGVSLRAREGRDWAEDTEGWEAESRFAHLFYSLIRNSPKVGEFGSLYLSWASVVLSAQLFLLSWGHAVSLSILRPWWGCQAWGFPDGCPRGHNRALDSHRDPRRGHVALAWPPGNFHETGCPDTTSRAPFPWITSSFRATGGCFLTCTKSSSRWMRIKPKHREKLVGMWRESRQTDTGRDRQSC